MMLSGNAKAQLQIYGKDSVVVVGGEPWTQAGNTQVLINGPYAAGRNDKGAAVWVRQNNSEVYSIGMKIVSAAVARPTSVYPFAIRSLSNQRLMDIDDSGNMQLKGYFQASDKHVKRDIELLSGSLIKLAKIPVYTYRFRERHPVTGKSLARDTSARHKGVMAQALLREYPGMVHWIYPDNFYAVSYLELLMPVLAGIQDMNMRLEAIQAEIEDLTLDLYPNGKSQRSIAPELGCYPNPVIDECVFSWSKLVSEKATIQISNLSGKRIFSQVVTGRRGELKVSVADYMPGIYIYVLVGDKGEVLAQRKFVVSK